MKEGDLYNAPSGVRYIAFNNDPKDDMDTNCIKCDCKGVDCFAVKCASEGIHFKRIDNKKSIRSISKEQLLRFVHSCFNNEKTSYDPTVWEEKESVSGIKYLWPKKI